MIVEHDFLMWIKNKQNVDRFLIFARSLITYIKKPSKIQSQDELLNKKPIIYISYLAS